LIIAPSPTTQEVSLIRDFNVLLAFFLAKGRRGTPFYTRRYIPPLPQNDIKIISKRCGIEKALVDGAKHCPPGYRVTREGLDLYNLPKRHISAYLVVIYGQAYVVPGQVYISPNHPPAFVFWTGPGVPNDDQPVSLTAGWPSLHVPGQQGRSISSAAVPNNTAQPVGWDMINQPPQASHPPHISTPLPPNAADNALPPATASPPIDQSTRPSAVDTDVQLYDGSLPLELPIGDEVFDRFCTSEAGKDVGLLSYHERYNLYLEYLLRQAVGGMEADEPSSSQQTGNDWNASQPLQFPFYTAPTEDLFKFGEEARSTPSNGVPENANQSALIDRHVNYELANTAGVAEGYNTSIDKPQHVDANSRGVDAYRLLNSLTFVPHESAIHVGIGEIAPSIMDNDMADAMGASGASVNVVGATNAQIGHQASARTPRLQYMDHVVIPPFVHPDTVIPSVVVPDDDLAFDYVVACRIQVFGALTIEQRAGLYANYTRLPQEIKDGLFLEAMERLQPA